MLGQIGFFDECVGPQRLEQLILRDDALSMLDQQRQKVECLRRQGLRRAVAEERALRGIQDEGAELEHRHGDTSTGRIQLRIDREIKQILNLH